MIDKEDLQSQPAKVEAIENMKIPSNKIDIQVFLDMIGYYRHFVPGFASKDEPLFHLLKDGVQFLWSKLCQKAFEELKLALMTTSIL